MRIHLEVITPERLLISTDADEVVAPGLNGELGILPLHAAMISQLKPAGILRYRQGSEWQQLSVALGFVQVVEDRVTVLAEIAELPGEIDVSRAQAAKARAEQRLAQSGKDESLDIDRAVIKLERAMARLQVAGSSSVPR